MWFTEMLDLYKWKHQIPLYYSIVSQAQLEPMMMYLRKCMQVQNIKLNQILPSLARSFPRSRYTDVKQKARWKLIP